MTGISLVDLVGHLLTARVLVLGDVMLDRYITGDVDRVSPEAPIPVLRARSRRAVLGGAANVAANVAALGARCLLVGVVGDDPAGSELQQHLAEIPGLEPHLARTRARPTTVKTRYVAGSQQLLRVDEEVSDALDAETVASLLEAFEKALADADLVVLSDYAKGVLCDAVLAAAIDMAKRAGKRVVADPKRLDFSAYRGVTLLTPNAQEATRATGHAAQNDAGAVEAGRAAMAQADSAAVLVTRSEKGLTLVQRDAEPLHLPTDAVEVADVTGAGDTLIAALATALAAGATLPDAARLANVAAGVAVARHGTVAVGQEALLSALQRHELDEADRKIVSLPTALERVRQWRARGLKVGFTNGCFDLIHPGHVSLLAQARAACDRLIVGLNTDQSVKRLKGPERPLQNEAARATVMASLAAPDLVILFAEDTPLELIRVLQPDVLVKGADYTVEQVVGADIVQAYGGKVVLADLRQGHSTTATIRRMTAERP